RLIADPNTSSLVKSFASGAGQALGQLGAWLLAAATRKEMTRAIENADPIVDKLITALTAYVGAVDGELRDLADREQLVLLSWEVKLAPPEQPPAPAPAP